MRAINTSVRLRKLLAESGAARAIGAHSPLSARIAAQVGFDCIWSSGLEISAVQGVPDAGILTMDELLRVAAAMAHTVDIPVLADCDSGFGNVNNVVHMVRSYETQGISGVCIEDKQFPKLNSFAEGTHELANADDFAAKIYAAKEAQSNPDFVVVARLEAFIAGTGLTEALRRADVYERAGADALLIHSKASTAAEVVSFREGYRGQLPVIVVPTTYPQVTVGELADWGFAMAIYANQGLRGSVRAMRDVMTRIFSDGTAEHMESELATVKEIFELQGLEEMLTSKSRYEQAGTSLVGDGSP